MRGIRASEKGCLQQERNWGQNLTSWCGRVGRVAEIVAEGTDTPEALKCLSPGCLHPFLLAHSSPARLLRSSHASQNWQFTVGRESLGLSLNNHQSCLPPSQHFSSAA